MNVLFKELRNDPDMQDREYRHAWADSHLNSMIAMQIKALREQREWTQAKLAEESEMAQSRISLLEDVNYSAWSISTLKRIAQAYDVRLKVSFEEFGSLEDELATSGPAAFQRRPFTDDPKFGGTESVESEFNVAVGSTPEFAFVEHTVVGRMLSAPHGTLTTDYSGMLAESSASLLIRGTTEPNELSQRHEYVIEPSETAEAAA